MSLSVNGTDIKKVIINNTELNKVIINNTEVWTGKAPYYDEIKNATSNVSEAKWLAFVEGGGIADVRANGDTTSFIGKNITLSNSVVPNYTSWKIADFNHDNSGNTCDLIQNNIIHNSIFGTDQHYVLSLKCTARRWITETYLPGFSTDVLNRLGIVYSNTDKIKLLSNTELGMTSSHIWYDQSDVEGTRYPIFESGGTGDYQASTTRVRNGTEQYGDWFTRTRNTKSSYSNRVWRVDGGVGSFSQALINSNFGLVPCIRFT